MNLPTIDELKEMEVIKDGHFVFTSGVHCGSYFNKNRIFQDPKLVEFFCKRIADKFRDKSIDVVVGPATGGIILSHVIAKELGCLSVWADKDGKGFKFKRNWGSLVKGKKVLMIEDVITTGQSVQKVIDLVREYEGSILALAALANRNPKNVCAETFDVPELFTLYELDDKFYQKEKCPFCKDGIIADPEIGHGSKFINS